MLRRFTAGSRIRGPALYFTENESAHCMPAGQLPIAEITHTALLQFRLLYHTKPQAEVQWERERRGGDAAYRQVILLTALPCRVPAEPGQPPSRPLPLLERRVPGRILRPVS